MKPSSKGIKLLVKAVVSTILLIFLLRKISISNLRALVLGLDGMLFFAAMGVFFVSNVLGSVQWHLLLRSSGVDLPLHRTFRFYFVGLFFNNFLPANIGGDAVKVYDVSRIGSSVYQVIAITLFDRIIGIFSLCLLATAFVLILIKTYPLEWMGLYLGIFIGCMLPALGFYFVQPMRRFVRRFVGFLRLLSLDKKGEHILNHLGEFKVRKMLVLKLMLFSLVIQALRVSTHILVGLSLGIDLDPEVMGIFFIIVPLLSLAMIPPVTINGLGVREGLGILLFAQVGIGDADAFTMEFLTYCASVLISLLGLFFFLSRRAPAGGKTTVPQ
jgi:uncharacterized protein (TIRG00374 family)